MERNDILAQLQQLRENCLQEYLQTQLHAITTQEVIRDVVQICLKQSDAEFLQSVAESMEEARRVNQGLKKRLEEAVGEGERSRLEVRREAEEEGRRSREEAVILERKERERERIVEEMKREKGEVQNRWKTDKTRLEGELHQVILEKEIVERKYESTSADVERLKKQMKKQKQLHSEKQQQWKVEFEKKTQEITALKGETSSQYTQLLNLREKTSKILSTQALLLEKNQQIEQLNANFLEISKIKSQLVEQLKQANSQIQQQLSFITSTQLSTSIQQQEIVRISKQLHDQQIETNSLREKNQQLTQLIEKTKEQKIQLQSEVQATKTEVQRLKATVEEQEPLLLQTEQQVWSYNSQLQAQKEQNQTLNQQLSHLQAQLYQKQTVCCTQQEEVRQLQTQLHRIAEQAKAEITTHRAAFDINTHALSQELTDVQIQNKELRENIDQLQEQLALSHQKDKYYEMYMEEIGSLKNQLQKYKLTKSSTYYNTTSEGVEQITKRSRIYQIICKLSKEVAFLKLERKQLVKQIQFQSQQAINFVNQAVGLVVSKVKQQTLLCSLCQHQQSTKSVLKANSPSKQPKMDKTISKLAFQPDAYTKIRKNLKAVQQKYQTINQENKYFTHHISSLINNQ